MSFIFVIEALTESCRKCRRLAFYIKVRSVAERAHTEVCNALAAFLGDERCNGGRSGAEAVPEQHGRNAEQIAEHHALNAEVTEKHYRIIVGLFGTVKVSLTGCIITAEVLDEVSEIRAVNAGTKEFIGVKGDFSAGDVVIFRCIDGEKGIFLSSIRESAKLEDITHRIIWGSGFWKVAPNGTRVYIRTDKAEENISAHISLKEYSEGF